MKKTLALLVLSLLAVIPATSAWAGTEGSPRPGASPSTGSSPAPDAAEGTDAPSTSRELFVAGCKDGEFFITYLTVNGFETEHPGYTCGVGMDNYVHLF